MKAGLSVNLLSVLMFGGMLTEIVKILHALFSPLAHSRHLRIYSFRLV
jgi:hypothetical protein